VRARQHRAPDGVLAADVRPRRAGAHRDGDARARPDRRRCRDEVPAASSLSIASRASTTTSNGSPACTRAAASTPPTDSIATPSPDGLVRARQLGEHRLVAIDEMPVIAAALIPAIVTARDAHPRSSRRQRSPSRLIAFCFRTSGRTSSRIGSSANSASHRSGVSTG
jgi:hypothetical protein